jgi:hypothetical protein
MANVFRRLSNLAVQINQEFAPVLAIFRAFYQHWLKLN